MTISYFASKSTGLQNLIRPMLFLSIGFHGLLLFMPMPLQETKPTKKVDTQAQVKVTKLPNTNKPVAIQNSQAKVVTKPVASQKVRQNNALVIRQKPAIKQPTAAKPTPQIAKVKLEIATVKPEILPTPTQAASTPNDPFADFPQYQNTQPGSLGLFTGELDAASQQAQSPVTSVTQFFSKELKTKKYEIELVKNESDRQVFQVTKGGATKFLNLFVRNGSTVITLASEALNPENIANVTKVSPQEEAFVRVLEEVDSENIDQPDLYLADPSLFYTKFSEGKDGYYEVEQNPNTIGTIRLIPDQLPEQVFNTTFAASLKSNGFEVNPQGQYGGGVVYAVKQGDFVTYLNLVPTADGTGTVIVSWNSLPS